MEEDKSKVREICLGWCFLQLFFSEGELEYTGGPHFFFPEENNKKILFQAIILNWGFIIGVSNAQWFTLVSRNLTRLNIRNMENTRVN